MNFWTLSLKVYKRIICVLLFLCRQKSWENRMCFSCQLTLIVNLKYNIGTEDLLTVTEVRLRGREINTLESVFHLNSKSGMCKEMNTLESYNDNRAQHSVFHLNSKTGRGKET